MQLAARLNLDYREGLIKNRYVGRTFIMLFGRFVRAAASCARKLNAAIGMVQGQNVLLVDDSSCAAPPAAKSSTWRSRRRQQACVRRFRSASLNVLASTCPRNRNWIATGRSDEIARAIGADSLIYQDLSDMQSVRDLNPKMSRLEASCFDGEYITGDITAEYLARLGQSRADSVRTKAQAACTPTWLRRQRRLNHYCGQSC